MFDPEIDAIDDELARPSVGQMIAGVRQPGYLPTPATPTPVPDNAPDVRPQLDPNAIPNFIRPLPPAAVPPPPSPTENSNLASLSREQAKFSQPINPYDPNTGKLLPRYKQGAATKILGTLANAMGTFGAARTGHPFQTIDVSPGTPNWRFGREEAQRQAELAGVNTQIGTQEKLQEQNEQLFRDTSRQAWEAELAAARKETADVRKQLETSQADLNEARANKANQAPEPKTEVEVATALENAKASGDKAGIAKWQGVLNELARQKRAGRDTSASDVSKAIQVAEYRGREKDRIQNEMENERTKRYGELDKNLQVKYDPNKLATAKQQVDQELTTKYAPRLQDVDTQADKMLGLTKSGAPLQTSGGNRERSTSTTTKSAAASAAGSPHTNKPFANPGDKIRFNGKPAQVTAVRRNPQTDKYAYQIGGKWYTDDELKPSGQ